MPMSISNFLLST